MCCRNILWTLALAWLLSCISVAPGATNVVPLIVESGQIEPGRDSRVFAVTLDIARDDHTGTLAAQFTWACGGETIISLELAERLRAPIKANRDLEGYVDGDGRRLFAGEADVIVHFGDQRHRITAWVMNPPFAPGLTGVFGHEIPRKYQWEINPDPQRPTLTLRPPGAIAPAGSPRPLAVLPLKDHDANLWINITVRNVAVDVRLIPQSTDFQAAPDLQKKWDMARSGEKTEVTRNSYLGGARVLRLIGKDGIHLGGGVYETDLFALLLDDNPAATSGIGQSLLNRFIYRVDAERGKFTLVSRVPEPSPASQPAP